MSSNKPFPSSDLDVFKENSLILDNFVNSQENEHPDRFGRKRPTITGIIKEAFNVRTDISNMNETLIGQSRWDAVPKNTSLSLGGDNGALNKQAQSLFNRTVMLKAHAREALRRTYLEAGYNLVSGSFEEGGTLNNQNDVLLHESSGKAFSGPAGVVPAGTNPASGGFVDKSNNVVFRFNSVSDMSQSTWLPVGALVETDAYNSGSSIGAAKYRITSGITNHNNSTKIPVGASLSAQLIWDGVNFDAGWSGAKLDGVTDDWETLHGSLKAIGSLAITSTKSILPRITFRIPASFKLSKTLWCGYANINIVMDGRCLVDNSTFTGDTVVDFDYSLLRAPVDIASIISRDAAATDGGWHGWNVRHEVDFENTNQGYNWTNTISAHQVNFNFSSNPVTGDVVYLNGYKITFGTDVTIGPTTTATRDNFVVYVGANFKFQAFAVGNNVEIYSANPWLCRSNTAAITLVKWEQGLSAVRVSNMWNGRVSFLSCSNFDVQLWENPCNKDLGSGNFSEFGMENNEYDFGKMQNCQIMHLATPVVRSFVSMGLMPYCIDTKLLSGSARISGLTGANTKPHYVNLIACKYLRLRTTDALEAETTGATTGEHCLCMVLGDNENYDYDIRYMAERYKNNARIYDIGKTGNGPIDIYVRTSFTDSDGVPTFIDNSKTRMNFSDISYAGLAASVGIEDKFTVPVFTAGKIGKLRDLSITGNVTLNGMKWYTRDDNTESPNISSVYWDVTTLNAKCDGYFGPGVTVVNETAGYCRFRVDHQGGANTKVIVRFLDSGGNSINNNTVTARGATYDASYRGFVSSSAGKSVVRCSIPAGVKAQVFIVNANDLVNSAIAKAIKIMQYHNEEMMHKD